MMRRLVVAVVLVSGLSAAPAADAQTAGPSDEPQPRASTSDQAPKESARAAFGSLFSGLKRDLKGLPSKNTAVTLGAGGALAFAVHPADGTLTTHAWRSPPLEFLDGGTLAGNGWLQGGAALTTWVVGQTRGKPRVREVGQDLVRAQMVAALMTQGLKLAVDRQRPDEGRYSFPSGHASATFANATVLAHHFGWKVALPAYGTAVYVAASRLQENQHFASDVIFGAALGLVAGHTVTLRHEHTAFAVAPHVIHGGVEVMFSHLPRG